MNKKVAFIFPGQGAQYPGMGKDFADAFAIARETFEEADDILQDPLSRVIFDGPEAELTKTKNSQLAIFVVSVALLRSFQTQFKDIVPNVAQNLVARMRESSRESPIVNRSIFPILTDLRSTIPGALTRPGGQVLSHVGYQPAVCAGLSLGEYTALWASGKMTFQETLLLVRQRANFMNEACETVPGTMAAVLGLDGPAVQSAIKNISGVWVANYNCPGQIVISGTEAAIIEAAPALKLMGAKRVIPLQVHGAFHSGLMQKAQDQLKPFIERAKLLDSPIALAMNAPGDIVTDLAEIRRQLILQVTGSVRWESLIQSIEKSGPHQYFEIGCGKTLAGFNKKMGFPTLNVEKVSDLEKVAHEMEACSL